MTFSTPVGTETMNQDAIRHARVIPLDVVQAKGSGHAGTAVGLTPFLFTLFQEYLRHDPADPAWLGRDRFVLSCGHTSLSLYMQLYLHGYGLEMSDLQATRTLDSITPGHPEYGHTPGVETTTGPLGQGIGNAVGMAMAARRVRGMLDRDAERGTSPFDYRIYCLASDGDMQEGISHEAASLAGHLKLENLVLIWDDNEISIEGPTATATSDDVSARMASYGWTVLEISDAESREDIRTVLDSTLRLTGSPVFIRLKTRIGFPMPGLGGTAKAHSGAPGAEEVAATKALLGLDPAKAFFMPENLLAATRSASATRANTLKNEWEAKFDAWAGSHTEQAKLLERLRKGDLPEGWDSGFPTFSPGSHLATRVAGAKVLAAAGKNMEELWGGSADLAETNGTWSAEFPSMLPPNTANADWPGDEYGRVLHFGVREHAMGSILNGIALNGLTRIFGATFFVFSDYMRPSVRLAALMKLPVTYIWTHDSVAVGEDGPTHEPVEHLWAARAIPGLAVVRPGDANETVAAYEKIFQERSGPTALVLSRQELPTLQQVDSVQSGTGRGGYVLIGDGNDPEIIIIATGSELHVAVESATVLLERGVAARVVSMPCIEWFDAQPEEYRESVLPSSVTARVSVEAGIAQGWYRFVGATGETVSVEGFGLSGNGSEVLRRKGISREAVIEAAERAIQKSTQQSAVSPRNV
ncbi:transketolase [Arthrobacter sp. zg-Y20]|uniref:transketolase n=1 Tax=unclassified Arthrobacter TaxID=235627 RepID=UPI001D149AEF|nr:MULTISPECIES: transketolase [unclassified Arthrobacter]MCC3276241.1 transketolase [Arthrobacter sp. zg-Y20]MDK1316401.1 transketolase [Arthrobacter sp. zg.Y20]WIB06447.1 transketolase [Arthrobacter sp. zg-Y20]